MSMLEVENPDAPDVPAALLEAEYESIKSMKAAVWQYFVDHGKAREGLILAYVPLINEQTFWRRVAARQHGIYTRRDAQRLMEQARRRHWDYRSLNIGRAKSLERNRKTSRLVHGTIRQRCAFVVIIALRRLANRLLELAQ